MDFFTTEVLTLKGLTTYYVLFFIHLETRRVKLTEFTPYPDQEWMEQQARNMTMEEWGYLRGCRYLLHDRDAKFCQSFRELIKTGSVNPLRLPARSPNLNSYVSTFGCPSSAHNRRQAPSGGFDFPQPDFAPALWHSCPRVSRLIRRQLNLHVEE
jgi:hypothetical protein